MSDLIHKPAVKRIAGGQASGEHMVQLFDMLAKDAEELGEDHMILSVQYLEEDDEFETGTYVPELILTVRRVNNE